jgi:hypothetical protein
MALTADTKVVRFGADGNSTQPISKPMGANVTLYRGSIAVTDGLGNLKNPGATAPSAVDQVWGVIQDAAFGGLQGQQFSGSGFQNTGAAGALSAEIATGSFYLSGSAGADSITEANVGKTVYLVNETTVSTNSLGGVRPVAGIVVNIDTTQGGGIAVHLGNAQSSGGPS